MIIEWYWSVIYSKMTIVCTCNNVLIFSGGWLTDLVEGGLPAVGEGLQVHPDLRGGGRGLQQGTRLLVQALDAVLMRLHGF